jgi:hypothetical protein
LQFNFYDHSKLILSSRGLVVTYINKDSQLSTWSLDELLRPEGLGHDRKVIDSIVKKVKYVKVLLGTIRSTSAAPAADADPMKGGVHSLFRRGGALGRQQGRPGL